MKYSRQSPHDSVLWELANHDGKMTKSILRQRIGMKKADLDIILADLGRAGLKWLLASMEI